MKVHIMQIKKELHREVKEQVKKIKKRLKEEKRDGESLTRKENLISLK